MNSFKKCIGNLRSKRLLGIGILILLIIPLSILMDSTRWGPSEASGGYITPTLENSSQETFAGPNYFFIVLIRNIKFVAFNPSSIIS